MTTLRQLQTERKKIKSGVADDTIFSAHAIMYLAEQVTELVKLQKKLVSDESVFLSYKIRFEHKNFIDALKEYQELTGETKK